VPPRLVAVRDASSASIGPVSRPPHASPGLLALVLVGGAAGSLLRYGLSTALAGSGTLATLLVNVSGALLLGALLELLVRLGPDEGLRRALRLGLGAGVLGAFTTYSALATETALEVRDGHVGTAVAYGLGSAVAGLLAALAGTVAISALLSRDRP
jgi:CrcB protein